MKTIRDLMEWCSANNVSVSITPGMFDASPSVKFCFDDLITGKRWTMAVETEAFVMIPGSIDYVEHIVKSAERNLNLQNCQCWKGQGRKKLILIHRARVCETLDDSRWLISTLNDMFGTDVVKMNRRDGVIDIFGVRIELRSGGVHCCAGMTPDYYITSDGYSAQYLAYAAGKVNGKRLQSLEDIVRVVAEEKPDGREEV